MQKEQEPKVERSRLTLLLGLTSTAAAAGCINTTQSEADYILGDKQTDGPAGEGEGGGGGSH